VDEQLWVTKATQILNIFALVSQVLSIYRFVDINFFHQGEIDIAWRKIIRLVDA